jgi:hypothetical protein
LTDKTKKMLRHTLPFLVSAAALYYLLARIDLRVALDHFSVPVLLGFLVPLLLFSIVTLAIEAQCLHRVANATPGAAPLSRFTAARIKMACYLLGVLHYALGAGGLSILLRRRTGVGLTDAIGMVFVITLFDVGSVLLWAGIGGALQPHTADFLRFGVIGTLLAAIAAGFVFLRTPFPLGPLEPLRQLPVLGAARSLRVSLLMEIGAWRLIFVGCFVVLVRALFACFGIEVGWMELAVKVGVMLVVSALPLAAGGLGTGQLVFVELFSGAATEAKLLAMSVLLSMALIVSRAALGLLFATEFAREAYQVARSETTAEQGAGVA